MSVRHVWCLLASFFLFFSFFFSLTPKCEQRLNMLFISQSEHDTWLCRAGLDHTRPSTSLWVDSGKENDVLRGWKERRLTRPAVVFIKVLQISFLPNSHTIITFVSTFQTFCACIIQYYHLTLLLSTTVFHSLLTAVPLKGFPTGMCSCDTMFCQVSAVIGPATWIHLTAMLRCRCIGTFLLHTLSHLKPTNTD